jgi:hypothetical protein
MLVRGDFYMDVGPSTTIESCDPRRVLGATNHDERPIGISRCVK